MPKWKQSFVLKNIDFYLQDRKFLDEWLKKWQVREQFPASRRKFEWQAGDLNSIWDCLIQMRPSGIRVKQPNYVPTLVALNQTPIYGPFRRKITELEAARLQGFPANWAPKLQSPTATYKQMGNAVNIGVIAHVFREHCIRDADVLAKSAEGRKILKGLSKLPENPDEVFASWGQKVRPPN
jgi:DNA (cytosine-5)-methyltransferase 1